MDAKRAITELAERQHGVISRQQALALGLSKRAILTRTAADWEPLHRAVYRVAGSPRTWKQRVMAACLATGPANAASHRTAGLLWSIPKLPEVVEVVVPEGRRIARAGILVHRTCSLLATDIVRMDGIPVTRVSRTLIDLGGVLSRPQLEDALDFALSTRLVTASQLSDELRSLGRQGRRGTGTLAAAIAARPLTPRFPGSELELRIIRVLRRHRLPAPACQHPVRLGNGKRAYLDLAYPEALLAIEADSYRHHSSLSDWSRDRSRNNELVALGWRILPVTFEDVAHRPAYVANQVRKALFAVEVRKV